MAPCEEVHDELLDRLEDIEGLEHLITSLDDIDYDDFMKVFKEDDMDTPAAVATAPASTPSPSPHSHVVMQDIEITRPKKRRMAHAKPAASHAVLTASSYQSGFSTAEQNFAKRPRLAPPPIYTPNFDISCPGSSSVIDQQSLDYFLNLLASQECRDRSIRSPVHDAILYKYTYSVAQDLKTHQARMVRRIALSRQEATQTIVI